MGAERSSSVCVPFLASLTLTRQFPVLACTFLLHVKVRGSGLFIGIEFVKPGTKTPDSAACRHAVNTIKENGILTSFDGPDQNVLRIKPPMCFSKANAKQLLAAIDMALTMTRMNAEIVTPEFDEESVASSPPSLSLSSPSSSSSSPLPSPSMSSLLASFNAVAPSSPAAVNKSSSPSTAAGTAANSVADKAMAINPAGQFGDYDDDISADKEVAPGSAVQPPRAALA
jgi:hypothetical protein